MKKLLALILVLLSLTVTVFAVSGTPLVDDEAKLLTNAEAYRLEETLQRVSAQYGAQILVVTVPSVQGDLNLYTENVFDANGANRDGVLLLVCMAPREYRILSNGAANDAISDREIEAIGDAIVSDLSDGDYAAAFDTFAQRCAYYLEGYRNGFPFPLGQNLLISLIIGLVVGLIVALILRGQLKSVHRQHQANVYIKRDSMRLTAHHDIFLYRNVTRRKRESSSSGSSSGGRSRSIGGGSF